MIEEYFKNWKNVMNEKLLINHLEVVSPEEFFSAWLDVQEDTSVIFNKIECKDGFKFSVQASHFHYCEPRETMYSGDSFEYSSMEVWFPTDKEPLIMEYCHDSEEPTQTVYWQVPVEVLNEVVKKHWGIINNIK